MAIKANPRIIFAAYANSAEGIDHVFYLTESVRQFGGILKDASIRLYIPEEYGYERSHMETRFEAIGAELRDCNQPDDSKWFYYSGKTFASGIAEEEAASEADILIWMDEDSIVLQEPSEFFLEPNIQLAYRPVMHNRSGTLFRKKPGPFWSRIYKVLDIDQDSLFPMVTPADNQKINTYFNAGLLVVRPQAGILRNWGRDFQSLYRDKILAELCRDNEEYRIFLHQMALTGVLNNLSRESIKELPDTYNYPLFFDTMFDADAEFSSIENIVTLRYDIYFRNPEPNWDRKLIGPTSKIEWIKKRLGQ